MFQVAKDRTKTKTKTKNIDAHAERVDSQRLDLAPDNTYLASARRYHKIARPPSRE
jgi:hypothetical protein